MMSLLLAPAVIPLLTCILAFFGTVTKPSEYSDDNSYRGGTDTLVAGDYLNGGTFLTSKNGFYQLQVQEDHNSVIYQIYPLGEKVVWATHTALSMSPTKKSGPRLTLEADGNLVLSRISDGQSQLLWSTNTGGRQSNRVVLQDDGDLVLLGGDGALIWKSGSRSSAKPTPCGSLVDFLAGNDYKPLKPSKPKQLENGNLYARGLVYSQNAPCGTKMRVLIDREVCGLFGCKPKVQSQSGWATVNFTGYTFAETAAPCRKGTHRYRVRVEMVSGHVIGDNPSAGNKATAGEWTSRECPVS